MTDNVANFSRLNPVEHLTNGVETGFLHTQEIELIERCVFTWTVKDRLDCVLLRALLSLSKGQPDTVKSGFSAWDLVEAVTALRKRSWSTPSDKERMSDDVRRTWNKLEVLWESKLEGIYQTLTDAGLVNYPKFSRIEGGGTGRATKYYVEWCDLSISPIKTSQDIQDTTPQNRSLHIKYICEDIKDPGFLAKIFAEGLLLKGWRRVAYIVVLLIPILMMLILVLGFILNVTFFDTAPNNQQNSLIKTFLSFVTIVITVYPMINLKSKGILLAPWWMQSEDEARLLEFRKPPRFTEKSIKAVSYSATCPICGAKVIAKSGGLEFFGRIIGRCDDAPVEHVFSFDYIKRQGRWLRK
ncbi:hypothetical protein GALL_61950 [mine drainage metagenome]|uniref:Uncharacterized protein n=1 Tax=mine drainage metagenome TaxID=410659 RepID=A0A1J5T8E3_9ZZZZ